MKQGEVMKLEEIKPVHENAKKALSEGDTPEQHLKTLIKQTHWGDDALLEDVADQALEELIDEYLIKKVKERIPSMKNSIKVDIATV